MKNFQTKLDVIGNNIANVNTFGFKKGRATFKEALNQTMSSASAAGDATGGRNAVQVGLGSTLAGVDTVHTNSNLQTTGRALDLGIEGDGFFVLGDINGESLEYTRSGNFYLDELGFLVNADGLYVMGGTSGGIDGPIPVVNPDGEPISSFSIDSNGIINVIDSTGALVEGGPQIALATFSNSSGLTKVGSNTYEESA